MNLAFRAILSLTLRSWIREKLLYSVAGTGGLLVLSSLFFHQMMVGEPGRIVLHLGFWGLEGLGLFLILFGVKVPLQEKTLYLIVSKPLSRFGWLWGVFCGQALILGGLTGFFGLLTLSILHGIGQSGSLAMIMAFSLIYLELLLFLAVAFCGVCWLTSGGLGRFCTLALFVIGHLTEGVRALMKESSSLVLRRLFDAIYFICPNLSAFDLKFQAVHGHALEWASIGWAALYGLAYTLGLLILAGWRLERLDL